MNLSVITHLRDLPIGCQGYIVGYDYAFQGYIGKLLRLGLTPGTFFTVIRHRFPDPFSHLIETQGRLIQLTKPEADALCIEETEEN